MEPVTRSGADNFTHKFVDLGDVRLHCVEAGPTKGKLVVLLHGFPEFWWAWRHQIRALADAGFRVVAPDMRGYNLSDKPRGVKAYRLEPLADDVARLIRAHGVERAHVVGHDWGGGVAWFFAMQHPEMLERLVILNAPHPREMQRAIRRPDQVRRSWYFLFFQLPRVPERVLRKDGFKNLRRYLRPDGLSEAELDRMAEAMGREGALTAAINYYRAAVRGAALLRLPRWRRVDAPVLVIWGERDRHLGKELARPHPEWVPNARVEMLPEATHWVHRDVPEKVNRLLVSFFKPS